MRKVTGAVCAAATLLCLGGASPPPGAPDKLTYHQDRSRSGWNDQEAVLTPAAVGGGRFGLLWRTPRFHSANGVPPRVFATPLYMDQVRLSVGSHRGQRLPVLFVVTTTGYAYAVNAFAAGGAAPGEILWQTRLTERPCAKGAAGNLGTPVIDPQRRRLYVTSCDEAQQWRVHALDISSGGETPGWPLTLDHRTINRPGLNRNGATQYPTTPLIQRGALNLSASGERLYVPFGGDTASGWLIAIDTRRPELSSAFSTTPATEETQGGMWASGGPAVDGQDRVSIATGASIVMTERKAGVAGVFPDSAGDWGQSILQFRDAPASGLGLSGTYTPFNYCQAAAVDIDLGSSGTIAFDLEPGSSATPRLLALGGAKQGNIYLLDRDRLPGSLVKRQACSSDPGSDGSLLAPAAQPQFGRPGPLNLFGPYSDQEGMVDRAKSRTTLAHFRDSHGRDYLLATGSSKRPDALDVSVPPGLARVRIVAAAGQPAHLQLDQLEQTQTLHNPGSPVVTSHGGADPIVWVLDTNAPRSAPLYGPGAPRPVLYAFDALNFHLLWKTVPGVLATSGKYNEPTIARGAVFVGTDRIEAFGLRPKRARGAPPPARADDDRRTLGEAPRLASRMPAPVVNPEQIYGARCVVCHGSGQVGIPTRATLGSMGAGRIGAALRSGPMRGQAVGLNEAEIKALSAWLSGRRD